MRYRTDCLAAKGFSLARHTIAAGVSVDVYNLHADAGADTGDSAARRAQFAQLAWFIANHSAGQALIVAGDTNLNTKRPEDMQILDAFLHATGLQVAAHVLDQPERIDRVMFRSSDAVVLQPMQRWIADEFVDQQGMELSDHPAVAVDFRWQLLGIEEN